MIDAAFCMLYPDMDQGAVSGGVSFLNLVEVAVVRVRAQPVAETRCRRCSSHYGPNTCRFTV